MSEVAVITCSTRCARAERPDDSGDLLVALLTEAGHTIVRRLLVADNVDEIHAAVRTVISDGARLVVTTGGTGLTPTDVTPEAVAPMLERTVPGIAEAIRAFSRDRVPTSALSRGPAGTIGSALVVCLPGSPGGVRDGMAVLTPLIEHAIEQISGGDHQPGGGV